MILGTRSTGFIRDFRSSSNTKKSCEQMYGVLIDYNKVVKVRKLPETSGCMEYILFERVIQ